jgi:hypothetical protein
MNSTLTDCATCPPQVQKQLSQVVRIRIRLITLMRIRIRILIFI